MNYPIVMVYSAIIILLLWFIWQVQANPITRIDRAIDDNDVDMVRQCLEQGVDPNMRSRNGKTLLVQAASNGFPDVAELLIERGADIDQGLDEEYGYNPLLETMLHRHKSCMKRLMQAGATLGLHSAAFQGDKAAVETFLQQPLSINSIRNGGLSALHFAAIANQPKIVELLLDKGADINVATYETPCYLAVQNRNTDVVRILCDRGADLNVRGLTGTPLQVAIRNGDLKMVKLLLEKGVEVNPKGSFPLHTAAREGRSHIAELLLTYGAKVNAQDGLGGETPLHCAVRKGDIKTVKVLIRHDADVNSLASLSTPLGLANYYQRTHGDDSIAKLLRSHGAWNPGLPHE